MYFDILSVLKYFIWDARRREKALLSQSCILPKVVFSLLIKKLLRIDIDLCVFELFSCASVFCKILDLKNFYLDIFFNRNLFANYL